MTVPSESARRPRLTSSGSTLPAGHGAEREKHAGRLDEDDGHDQAHGQARDQIEFRHAELQRQHDAHQRLVLRCPEKSVQPSAMVTR